MKYEIDNNNCLWIYESETSQTPFIKQPTWPDGSPWSEGEAEAWAEQFIANRLDPTADIPGSSPSQPTLPAPDPLDKSVGDLSQKQLDELIFAAVKKALGA